MQRAAIFDLDGLGRLGYRMLYFPIASQKNFMLSKFDPVLLKELAVKPVVLTLKTTVLLLIASDTFPPGDTS